LLDFISAARTMALPNIHVCTPYDDSTMPGRPSDQGVRDLLKKVALHCETERSLFLWAETHQLAHYYREMLGVCVYPLPLPVSNPPKVSRMQAQSFQQIDHNRRFTLVYMGAAREEKGFCEIPDLIKLCKQSAQVWSKVKFIIHSAPQIIGYNAKILEAIRKLEQYDPEIVKLIKSPLEDSEYHQLIDTADIVLLLYNQQNYQVRGSGIAVEAVVKGKSLLTTNGTFCASLIDQDGGRAVSTLDEAFQFILEYVLNPEKYQGSAEQQGCTYCRENSGLHYIERLIFRQKASIRNWKRPSDVVGHLSPLLVQPVGLDV